MGLARRDPRLFDEMLDWLALNHKLLSMQRLRNLTSRFAVDAHLLGAVIAWTREPVPSQLLKSERGPERVPEKIPVFSPDVLGFIAETDPTFEGYGFIRPPPSGAGNRGNPTQHSQRTSRSGSGTRSDRAAALR